MNFRTLKIGDKVLNTKTGKVGIVAEFMKNNCGVLLDLSNKQGIMFRWANIKNLIIV